MKTSARFLLPAGIGIALLAGCADDSDTTKSTSQVPEAVEVGTLVVMPVEAPQFYEATGTLKAQFNATLSSKVMAHVVGVNAREGDEVRRGQILVSLDSRELAAGVDLARANLNASQAGVSGASTAREIESRTSAARIAQSEAALAQAKAAANAAQSQLDLALAGTRSQEKVQARLAVVQAESSLKLAKTHLDRVSTLVSQGAMARKELEVAQNAYDLALAQRDTAIQAEKIAEEGSRAEEIRTAREGVAQAQAAIRQAEANVKAAKAAALQTRVRTEDIRAAQAQVRQSQAALRSAGVSLAYATLS
ncbi:MAG TPA: biotin/lipoyl-binding protein, partial [Fimbriimonadaceae bacterium]|nr:biotin/lipoyl-binding protein [Fimbriimonadaceae bacterium]